MVVAIVVVLLALMAPALTRAMEAAMRVKCASQLRVIHGASWQYAGDNRATLFISRFRAVPHSFNAIHPDNNDNNTGQPWQRAWQGDSSVNWIEALATVGLTTGPIRTASGGITVSSKFNYRDPAPVWNCPSCAEVKSWVSTKYAALDLQYSFLGGHDRWYNTATRTREGRSPVKTTQSSGGWVLVADRTTYPGRWRANHTVDQTLYPAGGNQTLMDGSVEWRDFETLAFLDSYSDADPLFTWQSDLGPSGLPDSMRSNQWPRP